MRLRSRGISRNKKPLLQLLTLRKVGPVAFMCEPCRLTSRSTNEQKQAALPCAGSGFSAERWRYCRQAGMSAFTDSSVGIDGPPSLKR